VAADSIVVLAADNIVVLDVGNIVVLVVGNIVVEDIVADNIVVVRILIYRNPFLIDRIK
jgi:hypothetical protein